MTYQLYLDSEQDDLYATGPWPKPFAFNAEVARVFDNMISRSVPLYQEVIAAAVQWAIDYHQPDTSVIDVGCSTGTFLELLGRFLKEPATLVGIDNSQPMLDKAAEKLKALAKMHTIELRCQSAADASFGGSSVVVMNYTLQFLNVPQRQQLLAAIYRGLAPGGLLFISEKVTASCARFQETATRHYEAFKARNGYERSEIERKKAALENVLVPLAHDEQVQMLRDAGFAAVDTVIKMHNFASFVALK